MSAGTTVRPDHRLAAEHGVVGDLHRLALDHDVQAAVPPVAAGGKHDVRPSVSPDGGDPEQLGLLQRALRVSSQPVAVAAKNARWGSTSREVASSFAVVAADNRPGGGQDSMV